MLTELILTGLLQGLALSLVTYAVMIPFRLLNFADLTVEGAYPLGGAIAASLLSSGHSPVIAMLSAIFFAGIAGIVVSLVHLKFKVNTLLSGIIVSTMLYSVNLKIMKKPNLELFSVNTLFSQDIILNIVILFAINIILLLPMILFLRTEFGLNFRVIGINLKFANHYGISVVKYTVLGLFIAGCYSGLAGGLIVQLQRYMDIGMGVGIVLHALAALMLGESIIGSDTVNKQLLAPLIGALFYQQIQGFVLLLGLAPSDIKLFTGATVLLVIALKYNKNLER